MRTQIGRQWQRKGSSKAWLGCTRERLFLFLCIERYFDCRLKSTMFSFMVWYFINLYSRIDWISAYQNSLYILRCLSILGDKLSMLDWFFRCLHKPTYRWRNTWDVGVAFYCNYHKIIRNLVVGCMIVVSIRISAIK